VTLTINNLQQFRQSISQDELPKTSRDVIYVCRYLGLGYLWIDSLCILQDSAEDWEIESSAMARVYGDADLNIAATSAKDGSVGCFFNRTRNWRCQIRLNSGDGEALYDCFHDGMLGPAKNLLRRRDWVVQEGYLSRRTLHFSEDQVFWECNENPASEMFPSGYPPRFCSESMASFVIKRTVSLANWPGIVDTYSRGALTKSSDKLVALAGLAKAIQENTKDDYIAGMWRTDLEDQLWWHSGYGSSSESTDCLAPSWSWTTIDGPVEFPKDRDLTNWDSSRGSLAIQVHDLQVQYASDNRFGNVTSAILRLRCDFLYYGIIEAGEDIEESRVHFGNCTRENFGV
jgi:hypothetical protein